MNRQLIRSYILLVAVAILLFTVPVAFTLTDQLRGDTEASVLREAQTMAQLLGSGDTASCNALNQMAEAYHDDVELYTKAGDRNCAPELPDPARNKALTTALEDGEPTTDWGSRFIWGKHLVITVPAYQPTADGGTGKGPVVGAVRIVYATSGMTTRLWNIWGFRAALAVLVLAAAAAIGAFAARRITAPLRELNTMASKFSDGDLTARSP